MMFKKTKTVVSWSVASAMLVMAGSAVAAGAFSLIEQSGSGMGNAFAGGAASAEDASTIYYNPAGMSLLSGTQIVVALNVIRPSAQFTPSATATGALLQTVGNNGGDPGSLGFVPNGYIAMEVNPALKIGLGMTGEREAPVRPHDYRRHHVHYWIPVAHRTAFTPMRPDQSRANCHAARPLRDPRSKAHCRASRRACSEPESGSPNCSSQYLAIARYCS